ncbi:MAG TPA: non-ribosomal peptide synthetase [Bryobacteraceae bacterium]|nr:non-ribosomal peptide synthetase [Bryobacteraceae bacterium]
MTNSSDVQTTAPVGNSSSEGTSLESTSWLPNGQACRRRSCVAHLVIEAATANPFAPALSDSSNIMTYGELAERSRRLASHLVSLGVRPDVPVALCLERSFDLITSAFAVLLAGGAYLPLDPAWPPSRINQIADDAQARLMISRGACAFRASINGNRVIDLDTAQSVIDACDPLPDPVAVTRENLAYVIYTSGSTGKPKGVEVTHGNLLNLIFWHRRFFDVTAADRASHLAGIAFDAAVWEIWPHLTAGATLVLADEKARHSVDALRNWLIRERISIAFVPTVLAEPLLAQDWPAGTALRYLLTGGDTLHRAPSPTFPVAVVNNYGPTECTVVATSGTVTPAARDLLAPAIGTPIAHTKIYLLDSDRNPVPDGEIGEIYIGGTSVARGYRNRPDATQERFLPDPFSPVPGARLYRTGDLGCLLPDGQIAFCGRADAQLEVHGHRIEPDEIVSVLSGHPGVAASAVVARGECCSRRLVAYIVPRDGHTLCASDLRDFLSERLPQYMVPSCFSQLDALPLNFNGKLDRDALPDPTPENLIRDVGYRAPNTSTEDQLSRMLMTLLGVDHIGIDDNFFLLGLHSLLATQVAARVYELFGVQLAPRHLFEAKTIARLAAEVDRQLVAQLEALSDEEVRRLIA